MTFRVTVSETAARQLRKLSQRHRSRIETGLSVLEEDPFRSRPKADIRAIEGTEPRKYRLRIGDYRVVYAVVVRDVRIIEVFVRGRGYR
ncbi:MAG: type II toxin-antitoxin system RelE/ParE family toxin, partial [Methanobacteriota archaeon]